MNLSKKRRNPVILPFPDPRAPLALPRKGALGIDLTVLPLPSVLSQETTEGRDENYTMAASLPGGGLESRALMNLAIRIREFTTDEEVMELVKISAEGGQDALRNTMEDTQKGRIFPAGMIGGDIAAARVSDGGKRIIVVTARSMPFLEPYYSDQSRDYPFGWYEFEVNESGRGHGHALISAKLQFNKERQLEIASYGLQLFHLVNVRASEGTLRVEKY